MRKLLIGLAFCALVAQAQTSAVDGFVRHKEFAGKGDRQKDILVERDVNHVFPYILTSAAWTTTFYITNLEDHEITVFCEFVGTDGGDKALNFDFDSENPTAGTKSVISPLATASFKTVSTASALTTAWAYCSSEPRTERFSGYALVRNTASNGAMRDFVTNLQPESEPVFSIPFLPAADNTTGLILLNNATETDAALGIWMIDNTTGKQVDARTLTLKPGALRVVVLNDNFKDVKEGTVRVALVEGTKYVTGMALRTSAAGYAALMPLMPKEDPPPAQ
ncbi:MAG: hypothetical protein JST16_14350 [Bdellovibrionales bacterium]|nr:hypothetical protein [Bdellovibrionales bacterium]